MKKLLMMIGAVAVAVTCAATAFAAKPYDAEVEYLDANATSGKTMYIDTGLYPSDTMGALIRFAPKSSSTSGLFGTISDDGKNWYVGGPGYFFGWNSNNPSGERPSLTLNEQYDVCFNYMNGRTNQIVKVWDRSVARQYTNIVTWTGGATSHSIVLFNLWGNLNNAIQLYYSGGYYRMYSARFTQGNSIAMELIPVRKDGVGYMFDKVTGTLLSNTKPSGAPDFVYGNDVADESYIEGTITLDADENWASRGILRLDSSAVIDLNGHSLTIAGAYGTGTITDYSSGAPGTLRLPEGAPFTATTSGNLTVKPYVAQTVKWNGSAGDGKMSTGANWDGGSAPAEGDTLDFSAVATNDTIIIADIPNTTFETITFGSKKFSVSGDLNLTTITRPYLMSVNSGATVTVGYVASDTNENYFIDRLDGTFIVTGQFSYNYSKNYDATARYIYKSGSGTVVASQFRVGFSNNDCYVNANNNHLVLGSGGLIIRKRYFLKLNNQTFTLGASADFTLGRREDYGSQDKYSQSTFDGTGTLYIDTTDFFDSTIGRTITIEGYLSGGTKIEARGKGTVVFDTIRGAGNAFNMGLNATDGVTIELKTGAQVSNGGATTFADGTTLKLPAAGSGAVTLKGPLAFSGTGAVNLKLGTGTEEVMKGEYELLTGVTSFPADFSNVVLINPIPYGTAATYVTDGTTLKLLVYRPKGMVIFVL